MLTILIRLSSLAALLLWGCGGDAQQPPSSTVPSTAFISPTAGDPLQPTAGPSTVSPAPTPAELPEVALAPVFPSLSFAEPTGFYRGPSGRFFVTEQAGRIIRLDEDGVAGVFLDLRDRVDAGGFEMGLLGFALAPDFAESGVFYVNYTAAAPRRSVVSRFLADPGGSSADPDSEVVVLEVEQPFSNHNGGQIQFGPDGLLYVALGDGGGGGDSLGNAQNLHTLLGKLLRLDVSTSSGYAIPQDNPFVGHPEGVREEIWLLGVRNPWRFSFDSETGELWLGDVGEGAREEIDLGEAGANYGWNLMEGSACFAVAECDVRGLRLPVWEYSRSDGNCAVIGGYVYRGAALAGLRGAYIYGDFCSGRVWALRRLAAGGAENKLVAQLQGRLTSFGVDDRGELYALSYGPEGRIFKLVAAD